MMRTKMPPPTRVWMLTVALHSRTQTTFLRKSWCDTPCRANMHGYRFGETVSKREVCWPLLQEKTSDIDRN